MAALDRINSLGFSSIQEYQEWHGLVPDGQVGPVTERSLNEIRICGHPDRMAMTDVRPWKKRTLTWSVRGKLPSIDQPSFDGAVKQAFSFWSDVCGLIFQRTENGRPDILIDSGRIDGQFGVLAYSGLPNGTDSQIGQKYDTQEPWVIASNPPRHKIDLIAVVAHELGHAIGLVHEPMTGTPALMNPTYNAAIRKPQASDIARAQAFYGRSSSPEPPVQDGGGSGDKCVILRVPSEHCFPWSDIAGLTTKR